MTEEALREEPNFQPHTFIQVFQQNPTRQDPGCLSVMYYHTLRDAAWFSGGRKAPERKLGAPSIIHAKFAITSRCYPSQCGQNPRTGGIWTVLLYHMGG